MKNYYSVPEYLLKNIVSTLDELLKEEKTVVLKDSSTWQKLEGIQFMVRQLMFNQKILPLEYVKGYGCTKKDLVEQLGLEEKYRSIDYAVPQQWCDHVKEMTGIYPAGDFVTCYSEDSYHEEMVPITERGKVILVIYEHMRKIR